MVNGDQARVDVAAIAHPVLRTACGTNRKRTTAICNKNSEITKETSQLHTLRQLGVDFGVRHLGVQFARPFRNIAKRLHPNAM